MKLVNTDGMALIGPGSEWFWTALSGIVLAVTFLAIYRQLRIQRSVAVFEQMTALDREYADSRFIRTRLVALLDLEGRDPAAGLPESGWTVCNWFDGLGRLVAEGHLKPLDVWHSFSEQIRWWWTLLSPGIEAYRAEIGFPQVNMNFESLVGEMNRLDVKVTGKVYVSERTLAEEIDRLTAALQREQDAAQGVIPTRRAAPTPSPVAEG